MLCNACFLKPVVEQMKAEGRTEVRYQEPVRGPGGWGYGAHLVMSIERMEELANGECAATICENGIRAARAKRWAEEKAEREEQQRRFQENQNTDPMLVFGWTEEELLKSGLLLEDDTEPPF